MFTLLVGFNLFIHQNPDEVVALMNGADLSNDALFITLVSQLFDQLYFLVILEILISSTLTNILKLSTMLLNSIANKCLIISISKGSEKTRQDDFLIRKISFTFQKDTYSFLFQDCSVHIFI